MRTLEDIEKDLQKAKEEAQPIIAAREMAVKKINQFYEEKQDFILKNRLYRPMSDLKQYANKNVLHIKLVERNENGELEIKDMYNDELFFVDECGHLDYSSYERGVMYYDKKTGKYIYSYHYHSTEYDFVGFLEIELEDEED